MWSSHHGPATLKLAGAEAVPQEVAISFTHEVHGPTAPIRDPEKVVMAVIASSRNLRPIQGRDGKEGFSLDVHLGDVQMFTPLAVWMVISELTVFIVPAYWRDGFEVVFAVHSNGHLVRVYNYRVWQYSVAWLGLLPFSWINLLVDGPDKQLAGVTRQFLIDSTADGIWGPPR